jgi:hypothetical protein
MALNNELIRTLQAFGALNCIAPLNLKSEGRDRTAEWVCVCFSTNTTQFVYKWRTHTRKPKRHTDAIRRWYLLHIQFSVATHLSHHKWRDLKFSYFYLYCSSRMPSINCLGISQTFRMNVRIIRLRRDAWLLPNPFRSSNSMLNNIWGGLSLVK